MFTKENRRVVQLGERFGRLLVQSFSDKNKKYEKFWICICDCGTVKRIRGYDLQVGNTQSCGCLQREKVTTHGLTNSPEFGVWHGMLDRALNPNCKDFRNYKGRGITISDEWARSFEAFYRDMGPRPSAKHSIERINNNLGYGKDNCCWATAPQQHANKRTNVVITFKGETRIASEWSRHLGGSITLVHKRLDAGWSVERALSTPPLQRKPRRSLSCP